MIRNKILIADDSLTVLKVLEARLKSAGYTVFTAADGSEALETAAKFRPDLVIMDVNFPPDISQGGVAWDGFKIIEWMRFASSTALAPAIIITSDDVDQHRDKALAAGAVAIFQKPINLAILLETIRNCLKLNPQLH